MELRDRLLSAVKNCEIKESSIGYPGFSRYNTGNDS